MKEMTCRRNVCDILKYRESIIEIFGPLIGDLWIEISRKCCLVIFKEFRRPRTFKVEH